MFSLTHPLPKKCMVAVSGGMDSMAALHFLMRSNKVLGIIHINHNTGEYAWNAQRFLEEYAKQVNLPLYIHQYHNSKADENSWRNFRYEVFHSYDLPVATAHHLDDCAEEYVICMTKRGYLGSIPYQNKNVIRPFRLWSRASIKQYVDKNSIKYVEDPSNTNTKYLRNMIRHEVMPHMFKINPGFYSMVKKAVIIQDEKNKCCE